MTPPDRTRRLGAVARRFTEAGKTARHHDAPPMRSAGTGLLVALPFGVILVSLMAWVTAVSRSGFWADDFLNLTHFSRSLGDLSNDRINAGHYVINVFWAAGTEAFGPGSVVPFLLLNAFVFAAGLVIWLRAGVRTRWGSFGACWIGGLFIATAAWFPTALWSSNITHSGGFLALGVGLWAHERCLSARTARGSVLWSFASGAAWILAVVSNLVYIGLLVIAAYCVFQQVVKIQRLGVTVTRLGLTMVFWTLLLPVVYFVAVAYPATKANPAYATTGLRFVRQNVEFYRANLAPTAALAATYVTVFTIGLVGGVFGIRRKDWFPLAVLGAAVATAVPALVQSQQRGIFYLAMPLCLAFSAAVAGARPVMLGQSRACVTLRSALTLGAVIALVLLFAQGADVRSYFVQSPYGATLASFRSEVALLAPESSTICARLDLDAQHAALFVAEMSGENGFLVPPINATQAYLASAGTACPAQGMTAEVAVGLNRRGDFVATRIADGANHARLPASKSDGLASLKASPNPALAGTTTIQWQSTSAAAVVRVAQDGQPERLFAAGAGGTSIARFIVAGHAYRFSLYDSPQSSAASASVIVTR